MIRSPRDLALLALGAVGVVYGDIGTSPLYAIKECFAQPHGVRVDPATCSASSPWSSGRSSPPWSSS
ncbi:MAG: KUP/HAK/KT family potassium transporter [Polyangiales bacterium]